MPTLPPARWPLILLSVGIVSVTSLVGMLSIAVDRKRLDRFLPYLISLAAGALLGVAGAHLLPEAIQQLGTDWHLSALLLAGFVAFFLVEKSLAVFSKRWPQMAVAHHHDHNHGPLAFGDGRPQIALTTNLLLGGAIHSLIDGMAVAIAYSASIPAGIATTTAVALHEVPHHIGDVAILVYGGMPARRAVLAKFAATSVSILGVLVVLLPGPRGQSLSSHLLPVTTASFLYIALSNLLPELRREEDLRTSATQVAIMVAGILIMFALYWVQEA